MRKRVAGHLLEHLELREQLEQELEHLFCEAAVGGNLDIYRRGSGQVKCSRYTSRSTLQQLDTIN